MGLFDRFYNNEPDDYDSDNIDDLEEEEEAPRRGGLFGRRSNQDETEEDENYEASHVSGRGTAASARGGGAVPAGRGGNSSGTPAPRGRGNAPVPAGAYARHEVIKAVSTSDAERITEALLAHQTITLNLEEASHEIRQWVLAYAFGTMSALHGNYGPISPNVYVFTPEDIKISGDLVGVASSANAGRKAASFGSAPAAGSYANAAGSYANAAGAYGGPAVSYGSAPGVNSASGPYSDGAARGGSTPVNMNGTPQDAGNPFSGGAANGSNGRYGVY